MRKETKEIIKELEETFGNSTIDGAIEYIEKLDDEVEDLKSQLKQTQEDFEDYKKYGRCYDE